MFRAYGLWILWIMVKQTRKIVHIDPDKCDGCGLCVPNCAEGAIQVINGKARLVAERLCDGLGACLGHCPKDAIRIEERPADEFDELAVSAQQHGAAHLAAPIFTPMPLTVGTSGSMIHPIHRVEVSHVTGPVSGHAGACPGSRLRMMQRPAPPTVPTGGEAATSQLRQWPVQLTLLPSSGPIWQDADVLLAADCVPFAYPAFHQEMLAGKTLAIACPKLDDCEPYVQKLAAIFANNSVRSVTVARMEVPCCGGLVRVAQMALVQAGREDIPLKTIIVKVDGTI